MEGEGRYNRKREEHKDVTELTWPIAAVGRYDRS